MILLKVKYNFSCNLGYCLLYFRVYSFRQLWWQPNFFLEDILKCSDSCLNFCLNRKIASSFFMLASFFFIHFGRVRKTWQTRKIKTLKSTKLQSFEKNVFFYWKPNKLRNNLIILSYFWIACGFWKSAKDGIGWNNKNFNTFKIAKIAQSSMKNLQKTHFTLIILKYS